jgi:UPF0755 protein
MRADDRYSSKTDRYSRTGMGPMGGRMTGILPRSPAEALEPDHAPEPPRGSKRRNQHVIVVFLNRLITLAMIGVFGAAFAFYFVRVQFDKPGPLTHPVTVVIPEGESSRAIAARLEREKIITDRRIFMASVLYFRAWKKLKAGEYAFKQGASIRQVLDTLVEGKGVFYTVSIPEGLTSHQIVERLRENEYLTGEVDEIPPEGSMLPDTYRVERGWTRMDVIRLMQSKQQEFLAKVWDKRDRDLPFKTQREAIIIASIVEKETGRADERDRVAAVFINRLRKGMRLDSDPTIIYGVTGGRGPLGRPIYRSDLERETPYNTYIIKGLPPTPIANPGRAAIEAVLKPAKVDDLFFVADGTGGHAFAVTYPEHQRNVAKWRAIERERAAEQAAAEAAKPQAPPDPALAAPNPKEEAKIPPQLVGIPLPEKRPPR